MFIYVQGNLFISCSRSENNFATVLSRQTKLGKVRKILFIWPTNVAVKNTTEKEEFGDKVQFQFQSPPMPVDRELNPSPR